MLWNFFKHWVSGKNLKKKIKIVWELCWIVFNYFSGWRVLVGVFQSYENFHNTSSLEDVFQYGNKLLNFDLVSGSSDLHYMVFGKQD